MNIEKSYPNSSSNTANTENYYISLNTDVFLCDNNCEFYDTCLMRKDYCVKQYFESAICTLLPVEETIIRSMFGILCSKKTREQILDILHNDRMCIIDDGLTIYNVEKISEIKRKALRKLRHPSRSKELSSTQMCIILFSYSKDTCYSKLWKQIFSDKRSNQELLEEFSSTKIEK